MLEKKALIIIDMQKDYLWDKRKPIFNYDTESLVGNVNRVIDLYKNEGYDIIYIKHILSKLLWGVGYSIRGTEGAELFEGVNVVSDYFFEKNRSDTFTAKTFREFIKRQRYKEVTLCGLDECGCVGATAKGAINVLCLNCKTLKDARRDLAIHYKQKYQKYKEEMSRGKRAKGHIRNIIAAEWFGNGRVLSFYTARRCLLGSYAEQYIMIH